jgi:hypothetical protein
MVSASIIALLIPSAPYTALSKAAKELGYSSSGNGGDQPTIAVVDTRELVNLMAKVSCSSLQYAFSVRIESLVELGEKFGFPEVGRIELEMKSGHCLDLVELFKEISSRDPGIRSEDSKTDSLTRFRRQEEIAVGITVNRIEKRRPLHTAGLSKLLPTPLTSSRMRINTLSTTFSQLESFPTRTSSLSSLILLPISSSFRCSLNSGRTRGDVQIRIYIEESLKLLDFFVN